MRYRLNNAEYEVEPQRISDVAELKSRMARGGLLYWTMIRPAHALLVDPQTQRIARLAFFRPLWGLQRSNQIRHDRYDGIYQVLVPTAPALERDRAAAQAAAIEAPLTASGAVPGAPPLFKPSI